MSEERREYQRLALTSPLPGKFGKLVIRLLDVSATGALIESDVDIPPGTTRSLVFTWRDHKVKIKAKAVRTVDDRAGLRFTEESGRLRELIA
ncbi:MAG: hypothetical protein NVSMB68_13030 [Thermoanaerobaculia bacterium]